MRVLILLVLSLMTHQALAQTNRISRYSASIEKYDAGILADIEKLDSKPAYVRLGRDTTDTDLAEVVKWDWISDLRVESDKISDITPITKLTNLKSLKLRLKKSKDAPIDLEPIAKLTNIESLDFQTTHVSNTQALVACKKLKSAKFYMSNIDSIDFVTETPDLEDLNLYSFRHTFKDYQPLTSLKNLKKLDVYMNKQATDENLAVLKSLTSLESIHLSNCKEVTTLEFLRASKGMRTIAANWCSGLKDVSVISEFDQIESVSLWRVQLDDLSFLEGKTKLKTLTLNECPITSLAGLESADSLKTLSLRNSKVTELSAIKGNGSITSLSLSNTPLTDLSVVGTLAGLQFLDLSETKATDLSALNGLQSLSRLTLTDSAVTDLSTISDLPKLSSIYLGGVKVKDFAPLKKFEKLRYIQLPHDVAEDQPKMLQEAFPSARINLARKPR